jgi:hypothetical protein
VLAERLQLGHDLVDHSVEQRLELLLELGLRAVQLVVRVHCAPP